MNTLTGELCFENEDVEAIERPETRGDCIDGPRPCPWVGCRYHLLVDVNSRGDLALNRRTGQSRRDTLYATEQSVELVEEWMDIAIDRLSTMRETCALDVAERGEHSVPELAELLGISRQSARDLMIKARSEGARVAEDLGIDEELREGIQRDSPRGADGLMSVEWDESPDVVGIDARPSSALVFW